MTSPLADDARTLADVGIRLRNGHRPGEHRAVCPECARRKPGRRVQELSVKIEPAGGATWRCWSASCGWKGSLPPPGSPLGCEKPRAKGDGGPGLRGRVPRRPQPPLCPTRPWRQRRKFGGSRWRSPTTCR
jgi:hypothetical protein